ncbi:hypothetical protein DFH09DRAFT_1093969 [Mycena vulgaris]|nr:hypothetical protein DFH09DRAFT_1093969 [Mycena vulgaris]
MRDINLIISFMEAVADLSQSTLGPEDDGTVGFRNLTRVRVLKCVDSAKYLSFSQACARIRTTLNWSKKAARRKPRENLKNSKAMNPQRSGTFDPKLKPYGESKEGKGSWSLTQIVIPGELWTGDLILNTG